MNTCEMITKITTTRCKSPLLLRNASGTNERTLHPPLHDLHIRYLFTSGICCGETKFWRQVTWETRRKSIIKITFKRYVNLTCYFIYVFIYLLGNVKRNKWERKVIEKKKGRDNGNFLLWKGTGYLTREKSSVKIVCQETENVNCDGFYHLLP